MSNLIIVIYYIVYLYKINIMKEGVEVVKEDVFKIYP
jgi:hypothetical protein